MRIERVTVGADAVDAIVRFEPGEPLRTSDVPGMPERALRCLPGLRTHRCFNEGDLPLRDELADTEIAHLLEHATLEIMAMAGSPTTLRGETSWDFAADGRGVFRVRLAFDDDLVALGALKAASEAVAGSADGAGPAPDVEAEARRLRDLRRHGGRE
jgi:hypothetical protein